MASSPLPEQRYRSFRPTALLGVLHSPLNLPPYFRGGHFCILNSCRISLQWSAAMKYCAVLLFENLARKLLAASRWLLATGFLRALCGESANAHCWASRLDPPWRASSATRRGEFQICFGFRHYMPAWRPGLKIAKFRTPHSKTFGYSKRRPLPNSAGAPL